MIEHETRETYIWINTVLYFLTQADVGLRRRTQNDKRKKV